MIPTLVILTIIESIIIVILVIAIIQKNKELERPRGFSRKILNPEFLKTIDGINERLNRPITPNDVKEMKEKVSTYNFGEEKK